MGLKAWWTHAKYNFSPTHKKVLQVHTDQVLVEPPIHMHAVEGGLCHPKLLLPHNKIQFILLCFVCVA